MSNDLSAKHQAFADYYIVTLNATKAAALAGYSEKTAGSIGSRLLKDVNILAYIGRKMAENTMQAEEALFRLSQMARADMGHFIGRNEPELAAHPESYLIKKYKHRKRTEADMSIVEETEIELYDSQRALETMMKYHELLKDIVEVHHIDDYAVQLIRGGELQYDALASEIGESLAAELFSQAGVEVEDR